MPSPVRQLQWESGLDYVYVATDTSVSDFFFIAIALSQVLPFLYTVALIPGLPHHFTFVMIHGRQTKEQTNKQTNRAMWVMLDQARSSN